MVFPCEMSGARTLGFETLLGSSDESLLRDLFAARCLVLLADPDAEENLFACVRRITSVQMSRGIEGEQCLPILVVLTQLHEALAYDLRNAGANYVMALDALNRGTDLLLRITDARTRASWNRGAVRFHDWDRVAVEFGDGTTVPATVVNESRTGIQIAVVDVGPFDYGRTVRIVPKSCEPMTAHVVRVAGRNRRGWCYVAMKWENR